MLPRSCSLGPSGIRRRTLSRCPRSAMHIPTTKSQPWPITSPPASEAKDHTSAPTMFLSSETRRRSRYMKSSSDGLRELDVCFLALRELAVALGCTAALLLHGLTPANASDIAVLQAWSRAMPKGANVAAGYLTIENRGNAADKFLSASTPVARKVAIHEMLETDGVMRMRPAKDGLAVPPHGKLIFAQGGNHLMFLQLTAPSQIRLRSRQRTPRKRWPKAALLLRPRQLPARC